MLSASNAEIDEIEVNYAVKSAIVNKNMIMIESELAKEEMSETFKWGCVIFLIFVSTFGFYFGYT
jgi:hypothetical protein